MRAHLPARLRTVIVATLLITMSIGMGMTLYRIWEIKQEVDTIGQKLTLDYGPQTTLIYDAKDRVIASLFREHRMPVTLEEISEPLINAVIDPAAGSESGRIGNLNPQSVLKKK